MKISTIVETLVVAGIVAAVVAPVAAAQSATPAALRSKAREAVQETRCTVVNRWIDNRIQHFNNRREFHINKYNRVKERWQKLMDKLDEKGRDTTTVREDGKVLDEKIKKLADDYGVFIAKLEETKSYDCGDSQGTFKTAFEQSRELLKTVRADVTAIRQFWQTEMLTDIKALKEQKQEGSL